MASYEQNLERVAAVWADQATAWQIGGGVHWLEHPLVQERINYKVVGEGGGDRYQYFLRKYLNGQLPVSHALTLGCGAGELERGLAKYDFCRQHDAVDISGGAIEHAAQAPAAAHLPHLQYRVDAGNRFVPRPDSYH